MSHLMSKVRNLSSTQINFKLKLKSNSNQSQPKIKGHRLRGGSPLGVRGASMQILELELEYT